jgi:aspartate racemase
MKTIGLLGGMSWESTVTYYQMINRGIQEKLGGYHSAKILLYSVDFAPLERYQRRDDWDSAARMLTESARKLEQAGADMILLCSNTVHRVAPQIQQALQIPLIHIADATADALLAQGVKRAALLGTRYTMTQDFCREILARRGIETLIPE